MAEKEKLQEKKPAQKAGKSEQAKPEKSKKPEQFEYDSLVRIYGYDLPGSKNIYVGLTKIKGISWSISNAILHRLKISPSTKVSSISKEDIQKIEHYIKNVEVADFLKNRRLDPETGKTSHIVGNDLDVRKDFDIKKLKKMKSYVGVRHMLKQPVRGQRTKSHFREKGRTAVGVKKKSA